MTRSRLFAVLSGLLLLGNLTTSARAVNLVDLSGWDIVPVTRRPPAQRDSDAGVCKYKGY